MRRRIFGDEDEAQTSRFLSEIPPDLIEDLSPATKWKNAGFNIDESDYGPSCGAAARPRGPKNTSTYKGKTYNSVGGVFEFLNKQSQRAAEEQTSSEGEFKAGARVKHKKYGPGVVLHCEGSGNDAKITVRFPGYGRKTFVLGYTPLEPA
jgi:DNA helicase-2/ATP-dependent DNA helicase PcrA